MLLLRHSRSAFQKWCCCTFPTSEFCFLDLHTVHSEHQGPAGEDGPLVRLSCPVLPWHPKNHSCGLWGIQHVGTLPRVFTHTWLLPTPCPPTCGGSLPFVHQRQQEGLAAFYQPGLPFGFSLSLAQSLHTDPRRHPRHWVYSDTLSAYSYEQKEW